VRFLADMGVSMTTIGALREAGGEAVHLREEGLLTLADDQILEKAIKEQRVILTFALDFAELLAAGGGRSPSVVLFRMRNQTPAAVTPRLFRVLETCRSALETGAIVIVEDEGYRVRPLPIRQS
jgi:predicted nuclease of predicted toxin-antitoxin system